MPVVKLSAYLAAGAWTARITGWLCCRWMYNWLPVLRLGVQRRACVSGCLCSRWVHNWLAVHNRLVLFVIEFCLGASAVGQGSFHSECFQNEFQVKSHAYIERLRGKAHRRSFRAAGCASPLLQEDTSVISSDSLTSLDPGKPQQPGSQLHER